MKEENARLREEYAEESSRCLFRKRVCNDATKLNALRAMGMEESDVSSAQREKELAVECEELR